MEAITVRVYTICRGPCGLHAACSLSLVHSRWREFGEGSSRRRYILRGHLKCPVPLSRRWTIKCSKVSTLAFIVPTCLSQFFCYSLRYLTSSPIFAQLRHIFSRRICVILISFVFFFSFTLDPLGYWKKRDILSQPCSCFRFLVALEFQRALPGLSKEASDALKRNKLVQVPKCRTIWIVCL